MHKPDGPLASTIGVIRANIDTKSAVDCEVLLKQLEVQCLDLNQRSMKELQDGQV